MTEEDRLKEKLRAIEARFAGTNSAGEREAAARARERIMARISEVQAATLVEWRFSLDAYTGTCSWPSPVDTG